ncbi:MAG: hypothetical protein JNK30_06010 [Phenylobacterium sp.]|uniref:hypothetical protein n=1 Tax=Phenylobacterium sp. TaxID=1871053 RepID=UPI001A5E57C8|nr:hypothetical protein [Phenylobacterium sp.]MBL8770919.1 hypothetical protein [Phenylobacterium sp.]
MPTPVVSEDLILRLGVGLTGATLLGGSALAADLAQLHMAALGTICGASTNPHCGWCLGAVGLALAGLTALGFATAPERVRTPE